MVDRGAQSRGVIDDANDALQPKVTGEGYPQLHMQWVLARNRNTGSCGKTLIAGGAHLIEKTGPPGLGAARRTSAGVLRATGGEPENLTEIGEQRGTGQEVARQEHT